MPVRDQGGPAMVRIGEPYLNGPISAWRECRNAKGEKFFERDGDSAFLAWDYAHFVKADLLSRFTAYRQAVGGQWMAVNEARHGEDMPNVEHGETVRQVVNMAPLGWEAISPERLGREATATQIVTWRMIPRRRHEPWVLRNA